MNIVVDTNIIISALIKNSITRKIIIYSDYSFFSPEIVYEEIKEHLDLIKEKSGLEKENLKKIIEILLKYINIISLEELKKYISKAKEIMQEIDPDDVIFIAAALCKNAIIWSDDKDFQKQDKIKILTTKEMIKKTFR